MARPSWTHRVVPQHGLLGWLVWPPIALFVGSSCASVDKPQAPDMRALVIAYERPTATLAQDDADTISALWNAYQSDLDELGIQDVIELLFAELQDTITDGGDEVDEQLSVNGEVISIEGEAVIELTKICPGWDGRPTADPANGRYWMTATVTDITVDPVVWVTFDNCKTTQQGAHIELHGGTDDDIGDLRLYVGQNLRLTGLGDAPVLVDIDVLALHRDIDKRVRFDARFDFARQITEFRLPLSDGHLIVLTQAKRVVGVRAANGEFLCDEQGACRNEIGDEVRF